MNQAKAAAQAKYPVSKVIHSAITIFLMFLFGRVIPPFGGITEVGMNVLGVFLGVIYGYCTCEIAWPSILGFVAYGLSGRRYHEGRHPGDDGPERSVSEHLRVSGRRRSFRVWLQQMVRPLVPFPEGVQGQADHLHLVLPGHLRPFRRRDLHGSLCRSCCMQSGRISRKAAVMKRIPNSFTPDSPASCLLARPVTA